MRDAQELLRLIDLALTEGKVSIPDSHPAQKRGSGEVEAEEVISVDTEKRKAC